MDNAKTIEVLEKLIETCRDGQEGYRNAAEHTHNPELKQFFERQSLERSSFAGELETAVQHLGKHDPERGSSISGKLHQAWFDLKQKLGGGDLSILESVEAGEDNAKKNYQEALRNKLPMDVQEVVERQSRGILAAHDRARDLRDRYKHAA